MELNEIIHQAQTAMDQGDYPRVSAACQHALATYPTCLSALRLLGESCLEQGEAKQAASHFDRVLSLDPLHVVARLGLGVSCEERGDPEGAYAHYLRAWDLNPGLDQIRDELVRLRAGLGIAGRVHPTRAGLASTYARGGQFGRAAMEWRAVLTAEPEGDRARIALAEVLWRKGDDSGAAAACREVLKSTPDNVRALAILAEIETRHGHDKARATSDRYRNLDPAGDLVALLDGLRPDAQFAALTKTAPLEEFVYEPPAVELAPDDELMSPPRGGFGGHHLPAPDLWDSVVRDLGPVPYADAGVDPMGGELAPFAWSDPVVPPDVTASPKPVTSAKPEEIDQLTALFVDPANDGWGNDDATATTADHLLEQQPASGWDDPAAPPPASDWSTDVAAGSWGSGNDVNPFRSQDGTVDLTMGWDQMDQVLEQATPGANADPRYDHLVSEFVAGGIAPFSAEDATGDTSAWEPFTADELSNDLTATPPGNDSATPPANETVDLADPAVDWPVEPGREHDVASTHPTTGLAALTEGWDNIDQELEAAIPSQMSTGYTEMLRNIDSEGVSPFDLADAPDATGTSAPRDATGEILQFDDLLNVTSRDNTAKLDLDDPATRGLQPFDVSSFAAGPNTADPFAALGGVQPFSFDDASGPASAGIAGGGRDFSDVDDVVNMSEQTSTPSLPPRDTDVETWLSSAIRGDSGQPEAEVSPDVERVDWLHPDEPSLAEARSAWPSQIDGTSILMDLGRTGLFTRLREEKAALLANGRLHGHGSLLHTHLNRPTGPVPREPVALTVATVAAPLASVPVTSAVAVDETHGLDVAAMRDRLKGDAAAASEVATTLEAAIAAGASSPLVLRVLGEAYLKLGRGEQAAAQFRMAMSLRGRRR